MSRREIERNIIIDEVEGILEGLNEVSSVQISDLEVVIRFINEEKNTKFYIDNKLTSRMQDENGCIYLWLDTGLQNKYGNPIFISMLKNGSRFEGHYYGTADVLAKSIRPGSGKNAALIPKNLKNFKEKYFAKCEQRDNRHIVDEKEYLLNICNGKTSQNIMKELIQSLDIEYDVEYEEIEEVDETQTIEESEQQTEWQKEITVELLLDELDKRQAYEEDLLAKLEELSSKYKEKDQSIEEMKQKNREYKQAMVQMRTYLEEDEEEREKRIDEAKASGKVGHVLLNNKKILVLGGTELGENIMKGIAKSYGFENKDFVFETDYTKVVSYSGRIQNSSRYFAVIFGACPHKVAGLGDYSSLIEKYKQCDNQPYSADARSKSGKLKMTKASFRNALHSVCNNLGMALVG